MKVGRVAPAKFFDAQKMRHHYRGIPQRIYIYGTHVIRTHTLEVPLLGVGTVPLPERVAWAMSE